MTLDQVTAAATTLLGGSRMLLEPLEKALDAAEAALQKADALFEQLESRVETMKSSIAGIQGEFTELSDRMNHFHLDALALEQGVADLPVQLTQQLNEGRGWLVEWSDALTTAVAEAGEVVEETLEQEGEDVRASITSHVEMVETMVSGMVEDYEEKVEELLDYVSETQEELGELAEELFQEALPEAIGEQGAEFLDGVQALRETGLDKLQSLDDAVGGIQDKTKALTDLVEQVKPVLEIAAKVA